MTYTVSFYNTQWKKKSDVELNSEIFNDSHINDTLIHEFVLLQLANRRQSWAHTKDRWEVNFSNRKLFKQKGTWNWRPWSLKSPTRKQGWVVFWPTNEINWKKKMNLKSRKLALLWCLIYKAKTQQLQGLTEFDFSEIKTKNAVNVLSNLWKINEKVLIVTSEKNNVIEKSFSNLPGVKTITVSYLNPVDVLHATTMIVVWDALDKISTYFESTVA